MSKHPNPSKPTIKGLVLAGGRSVRMKKDKTKIKYHGIDQREYIFKLISPLVDSAYYSIRPEQTNDFLDQPTIEDRFKEIGPFGAILSAMTSDPDAAWLVTASDQPFITEETIKTLISKRNPSKYATAFFNPETKLPEPLITIWEPRAYPVMHSHLEQGITSPRKVLINSDIELIRLNDNLVLRNVNTPEEYEVAKSLLR